MTPALAIAAAGAAGVAAVTARARSVRRYADLVREARAQSSIQLSREQRANALLISQIFMAAGLTRFSRAAVTNAYAESRLDASAAGDGGKAIGLFQLHEAGAGRGMSVEERSDPVTNTWRIVAELYARGGWAVFGTNSYLVEWFAHEVERCAACGHQSGDDELSRRVVLLGRLYSPGVMLL